MSIDLGYRFGKSLHSLGVLDFASKLLEEAKIATHEFNLDNVATLNLEMY
jgi:hypothetical protein